jgi:hypothetical protein
VVTLLQIGQYFLERRFAKGRGERRAKADLGVAA